jgi:hypothetical protein
MKVLSVGIELFHANGRIERHNKANSRFSQFCEKRLKIHLMQLYGRCLSFVLYIWLN